MLFGLLLSILKMETLLCYFTIFVSLFLVVFFKTNNSTRNLPPGPWKIPVIGNLHQFVGHDLLHRRLLDLANKYGPVMYLQLGQIPFVVISSPEHAKEVTKTHDLIFATKPVCRAAEVMTYNRRDLLCAPYGDYWRQARKICTLELFSAKQVQSFRSIREEEVARLITSIASNAGTPVNLTSMAEALSYCIISRAAFGGALKQNDTLYSTIHKAVCLFDGLDISELFPSIKILDVITGMRSKIQKVHQEVDTAIQEVITEQKERKKSQNTKANDLVSVLLSVQEDGKLDIPLTTDDIKALIMDIFLGGVDTAPTVIEWAMSELVKHPNVITRAKEEIRRIYKGKENISETSLDDLIYLSAIIKETFRLHPPVPLLYREAQEEVVINGYKIPKKTKVSLNVWAIGRDPRYWTEPEKFYPERFLNSNVDFRGSHHEFMPFGAGRRICPGIQFGMSLVELVLANLLYHFDWKIPIEVKPEDFDMSELFGNVTRRKNNLCLIPTLYHP